MVDYRVKACKHSHQMLSSLVIVAAKKKSGGAGCRLENVDIKSNAAHFFKATSTFLSNEKA